MTSLLPNGKPSGRVGQAIVDCVGGRAWVSRPLQGVERHVAWSEVERQRAGVDSRMVQAIEAVAAQHRIEVWRALSDGWQSGEYDRVLADAVPRYARVLREYANMMQRVSEQWALDEAERQARSSDTQRVPASPSASATVVAQAQRQAGKLASRVESSVEVAARSLAHRVQGEVAVAAQNGATERGWKSAIAATALAKPALAIGQIMESEGRVQAAASIIESGAAQRLGLRLGEVVRTSVRDHRRCSVCTRLDGTAYELPRQQAQFDAMPLPDPNCLGGTRYCRCGWLLRWVREDRMQVAA